MRNFLRRQWPLIGLGVILILLVFYAMESGETIMGEPLLKQAITGQGLDLKDIHYTQDDPDKGLKWILDASEVRCSGDKNLIVFRDFQLRLKPKNRPLMTLTGKRGDYNRESGKISLWGDLEGTSGDGYKILTEQMVIDEKRNCLSSEEAVTIYGPFFSVVGRGLFADLKKEQISVLSHVTTVVQKESLS